MTTHDPARLPTPRSPRWSRGGLAGVGLLLAAGVAVAAAASVNFNLAAENFSAGGGTAASANFAVAGAASPNALTADHGAGNQRAVAASTNFIVNGSFGGAFVPGGSASGLLTAFAGTANPGPTNELATTTATLPILQVILTAGTSQAITVNAVTFTASGTGHDVNDLAAGSPVACITDLNGNGVADAGEPAFAAPTQWSADNGTATFAPAVAPTLNAGSSIVLLLRATFGGTGSVGSTFTATLGLGSVTATDPFSNPVPVGGLPIAGGTKTLVGAGAAGSLTVSLGAGVPSTPVSPGASGAPWLLLDLAASSVESVSVSSVALTASGTAHDGAHIATVTLLDDLAGTTPGVPDAGDLFIASGAYPGDDGRLALTFASPRLVPAGGRVSWLVVYDLNGTAQPGTVATASVVTGTDIQATGATSLVTIVASGTPVGAARAIAIAPRADVTVSSKSGGCSTAPHSAPDVPSAILGALLPWLLCLLALTVRRRRV